MRSALAWLMPGSVGLGRATRLYERNLRVARRSWIAMATGFFEPVFYLVGLGFGVGALVGEVDGLPYAVFVAPALMATSAMNGAIYDATFNMFFKLRYAKTYDAVLSTPLGPADVASGVPGGVDAEQTPVTLPDHEAVQLVGDAATDVGQRDELLGAGRCPAEDLQSHAAAPLCREAERVAEIEGERPGSGPADHQTRRGIAALGMQEHLARLPGGVVAGRDLRDARIVPSDAPVALRIGPHPWRRGEVGSPQLVGIAVGHGEESEFGRADFGVPDLEGPRCPDVIPARGEPLRQGEDLDLPDAGPGVAVLHRSAGARNEQADGQKESAAAASERMLETLCGRRGDHGKRRRRSPGGIRRRVLPEGGSSRSGVRGEVCRTPINTNRLHACRPECAGFTLSHP